VDTIREFVAELADEVEAGALAPKTVNNTLGTLVVCLNAAVEDGVLAVNPALRVQRLPAGHIEREYLRLEEIAGYLDACSSAYRPLAELLIGSGLRISEALGLTLGDLELEETGGTIIVYRSRKKGSAVGSTKSDRFRSVEIGPGLSTVLRGQVDRRAQAAEDRAKAILFTMPQAPDDRLTEPPSRAAGTRTRCRTPRCATCRCTHSGTQPPPPGWLPGTR
jgi:integrase